LWLPPGQAKLIHRVVVLRFDLYELARQGLGQTAEEDASLGLAAKILQNQLQRGDILDSGVVETGVIVDFIAKC
jgi:hypothetical protein